MKRISFTPKAYVDYLHWLETDKKNFAKINTLILDIAKSPYFGIGKPEPLKHNLTGHWSRRIND
jgi:toxin YoeB